LYAPAPITMWEDEEAFLSGSNEPFSIWAKVSPYVESDEEEWNEWFFFNTFLFSFYPALLAMICLILGIFINPYAEKAQNQRWAQIFLFFRNFWFWVVNPEEKLLKPGSNFAYHYIFVCCWLTAICYFLKFIFPPIVALWISHWHCFIIYWFVTMVLSVYLWWRAGEYEFLVWIFAIFLWKVVFIYPLSFLYIFCYWRRGWFGYEHRDYFALGYDAWF
jgi:hypothetical protein